jgi:uracil-DNA glycosylase family 4
MIDKQLILNTVAEINYTLNELAAQGHRGFECSPQSLEKLSSWGCSLSDSFESLETIRADLGDCRRCKLASSRTNIVFGKGNPNARLVFVGEGPGFDEDKKGEPFVGAAGQLLTKIIEAIKLSRAQVYICNIIKCRPPGNRNPEPDEIEACSPFLQRQIAAIKPNFICTLGKFAAQTLLKTDAPISKLRGRFHEYRGIKVMPTYHPAYLLRNPEKKREVWEDMKKLMREYGYED